VLRTSENCVKTKFAEFLFHALGDKGKKKGGVPPLEGPSLPYGSPTSPLFARDREWFAPNYRSEQPESVCLPLDAAWGCTPLEQVPLQHCDLGSQRP
jgi:hypothetical protein